MSALHCPAWMSYIIVRAAFVASVTCETPLVSRQIRKLSMVPNSNLPFAASSRDPSCWSSSHFTLVPLKYGSGKRPVILAMVSP